MKQFVRNERGMALAIAIFALVIVGALVAGAMFAGTQEQRIGETTRRLEQSFGVSELGIYNVVNNWNPTTTCGRWWRESILPAARRPRAKRFAPRSTNSRRRSRS